MSKNKKKAKSKELDGMPDPAYQRESELNGAAELYVSTVLGIQKSAGTALAEDAKRVITTEDGGVYILRFEHVCGPRIDCRKLDPR